MRTPLVTVVIPTHNRFEMLEEALESLMRQTLSDWEAVVVDDGSSPAVAFDRLTARFGGRVRGLRHEVPRGGPAAKNSGVRSARGQFLAYLDDDDLYHPAYLASAVRALAAEPSVDVVFMDVSAFGSKAVQSEAAYARAMAKTLEYAQGTEVQPGLIGFDERLVYALLRSVPMAFQRPVVRRSAIDEIGLYREHCFLWDCDWAIRAALAVRTALLTDPLYLQRAGDQGYSTSGSRLHDAVLSQCEIKQTLFARSESEPELRKWRDAFREATARSLLDLAYFYRQQSELRHAWQAWMRSQQYHVSIRRFSFLVRLAATALSRRRYA